MGGHRTVMHRTRTLDYVVVIEGEIVLVLERQRSRCSAPAKWWSSAAPITPGRTARDTVARMAFFHIAGEFTDELLAKLPQPLELME